MKTFKLNNETKIKTGFTTPEHYFDDFSTNFLENLPKKETKTIALFDSRKKIFWLAAAILVVALMVPIYIKNVTNSKEINQTSLENYISYQTNINQYDLISELESEDIIKMQPTSTKEEKAIEDALLTNSDIENLITE